jgi:geranylgeranyl pyrophosphate synthase
MHSTLPPPSPGATKDADTTLEAVNVLMKELLGERSFYGDEEFPVSVRAGFYHLESGGHRIRARLALHVGSALGMARGDAVAIASAVELLHNASLVHDDLQDVETERRGLPTVARVYGGNVAICVGDLFLSAAYAALSHFSHPAMIPQLLALMHARTATVIRGQCAELSSTSGVHRIDEYVQIVKEKSGVLLGLPMELALLGAGKREWLEIARSAAENFGVGYQIVDDIEDFERDTSAERKSACLNVLGVLMHDGSSSAPLSGAKACAERHFDLAEIEAARLPNGSGDFLLALSGNLRERL